jgi:hypothetical protein
LKNYDITNGVTPEAEKAIENAIRQNKFYQQQRANGPSFNPNDRKNKTATFYRVNPSFLLITNFGTVEVSTSYSETINLLIYSFKIFVNQERADESILKNLLKNKIKC